MRIDTQNQRKQMSWTKTRRREMGRKRGRNWTGRIKRRRRRRRRRERRN